MNDAEFFLPDFLGAVAGVFTGVWIIRQLVRGRRDVVLPVMFVMVALTVPGMILDSLRGIPDLSYFPGFGVSSRDETVRWTYALYVTAAPWITYYFGRPRASSREEPTDEDEVAGGPVVAAWVAPIAFLAAYAPVAMLVLEAPAPGIYRTYGAALSLGSNVEIASFHGYLAGVCRLGLVAAALFLLAVKRANLAAFIVVLPAMAACLWIVGKRGDIAIAVVLIIVVVWQRRILSEKALIAFGALAGVGFMAFSSAYQSGTRVEQLGQSSLDSYVSNRIDFGRDSQIRMSIYAHQNPQNMQILEHPGQSYLFYATMVVPRAVWSDKPLPYAQYFTSAMFLQPPKLWGWGMTTSWIEESISNLGIFGYLFGPASLGLFCRMGQRAGGSLRLMTMLIASMLLALQLVAIAPLIGLWVLLYFSAWWKRFTRGTASGGVRAESAVRR